MVRNFRKDCNRFTDIFCGNSRNFKLTVLSITHSSSVFVCCWLDLCFVKLFRQDGHEVPPPIRFDTETAELPETKVHISIVVHVFDTVDIQTKFL